jgi:hypothetical protein
MWSEPTGNITTVTIIDFNTGIGRAIYALQIPDTPFFCRTDHVDFPDPFTNTPFGNATYGGISTIDGHIVNLWNNVGYAQTTSTVALDAFTGLIVWSKTRVGSELHFKDVTENAPDPRVFEIPPEVEKKCIPGGPNILRLLPRILLF